MHLPIHNSLIGIAALVQLVRGSVSSTTYEICTTKYGTTSPRSVSRSTYVLDVTLPACKATSVVTPVKTVTPAPTTVGVTVFVTTTTTEPVVTDTFSSTSTETDTSTVEVTPTTTVTNTITTTTTLPTPTSTVPTSPGFVPAASATATYAFSKRRGLQRRRVSQQSRKPPNSCSYKNGHIINSPAIYPTAVQCGELVEIYSTSTITTTAKTTATVTATTPPAVTATITNSITSTVYPVEASTTLTFDTTITATTTVTDPAVTSTVSTTMTVTVTPPQATYYAACDPSSNQISQVNGYGIDNIAFVGSENQVADIDDPYDCCVACIQDPNCGASASVAGFCQLFYPSPTCQGPNTFAGYYYGGATAGLAPGDGFTVSDGNCGQVVSGGTD